MSENLASALSYLFLPAIVFLVMEPYNRNRTIRFHAFQGLFLGLAWFAVWILFSILSGILAFIPVFGWIVIALGFPVLMLVQFALLIYCAWKAYNHQPVVLPVIGPMAQQQAAQA